MPRLQLPVKSLREGAWAMGSRFVLAVELPESANPIVLCSGDQQLLSFLGNVPSPIMQMLDSTDGKIRVTYETESGTHRIVLDYDGDVGGFLQQMRQPLQLAYRKQIEGNIASKGDDKVIPLPHEFESAIDALLAQRKNVLLWKADGTFKLV